MRERADRGDYISAAPHAPWTDRIPPRHDRAHFCVGGARESEHEDPLAEESSAAETLLTVRTPTGPESAWIDFCARSLTACGRLASPGPSGLRAEHLREAASYRPLAAELRDALAAVTDALCAGAVPGPLRDGRLFLLPKPRAPDSLRPVGAGEVLRNVA